MILQVGGRLRPGFVVESFVNGVVFLQIFTNMAEEWIMNDEDVTISLFKMLAVWLVLSQMFIKDCSFPAPKLLFVYGFTAMFYFVPWEITMKPPFGEYVFFSNHLTQI